MIQGCKVVSAIAAVLFACTAQAATNPMVIKTGADLRARCTPFIEIDSGTPVGETDRVISAATCIGYIKGFRDSAGFVTGFIALKQTDGHVTEKDILERSAYCERPDLTVGEIARLAVAYIERHPEDGRKPAGLVMTKAMIEKMPCR